MTGRSRSLSALLVLLLSGGVAQASTLITYDRSEVIENPRPSETDTTVRLWLDDSRARLDMSGSSFYLDAHAETLTHLRPDATAVAFPLPVRLETAASDDERATLARIQSLVTFETTLSRTEERREISGYETRLVRIERVWGLGGRTDVELWVTDDTEVATQQLHALFESISALHLGGLASIEAMATVTQGELPVLVIETTEGQVPRRTQTLRLRSIESQPDPAPLALPSETRIVPFELDGYVRVNSP